MTTNTKEIVDNAIGDLSTTIANISSELQEVASKIESEVEAEKFIRAVTTYEGCLPRNIIKDIVTDLALKHEVWVSLGDYGNGESLQLTSCSYYGYSAGDWVSSSDNC